MLSSRGPCVLRSELDQGQYQEFQVLVGIVERLDISHLSVHTKEGLVSTSCFVEIVGKKGIKLLGAPSLCSPE